MQITYKLSLDDYRAAQLLHVRHNFRLRLMRILTHRLFPVCGVIFLVLAAILIAGKASVSSITVIALCGAYLALLPFYLDWRIRNCYTRTRSNSEECTARFSEEHVLIDARNTKSEFDWSAIQSFREGPKVFMLYLAPAKFVAVPKRVCTQEQIDELRSLFARRISPAR